MANISDYYDGTGYIILYKHQFKRFESFYCRLKQLGIKDHLNKEVCYIKVYRNEYYTNIPNKRSRRYLRITRQLFKHEDYFDALLQFLMLPETANEFYIPIHRDEKEYMAR